MSLRIKLFLPIAVLALAMALYLSLEWMPKTVELYVANQFRSGLNNISEGMVPLLLDNRLANIYDYLDNVLATNEGWREVRLFNSVGNQLYPLDAVGPLPFEQGSVRIYHQDIIANSDVIAHIDVVVDTSVAQATIGEQLWHLLGAFYLLLFTFIVTLAVVIEKTVRKPINGLMMAASRLGAGDYAAPLPSADNDEVGQLIKDFARMRAAIAAKDAELTKAKDAALEASRLKSEFLANISHEIRTPLNGVMGTLELLRQTEDPAIRKKYIELAHRSSTILLGLLNDVLDISKIEAGKLQLETEKYALRPLVREVVELFEPMAQEKSLAVNVEFAPDVPEALYGDSQRVCQVLSNLVSNAIKFTEHGTISVGIAPHGEGFVDITVQDTGIGIPREKMGCIFQPFEQVDGSNRRRYAGSGLGLYLCRRLVTMMGGRIEAVSTVGKGSRFTFSIPRGVSGAGERPPAAAQKVPTQSTATAAVLLVEDNQINQVVVRDMLQRLGYQVDVAASGVEALERYREQPYDAIIMDCHMPEMDGFETTAAIRQLEGSMRHTPIIALTADAMAGDRERCLVAGMDDYLMKPATMEDLDQRLSRWLPADAESVQREKSVVD